MSPTPSQEDLSKDLGLGSRLSQQSRLRFLNQDGSFNAKRKGLPFFQTLNLYHFMLSISWMAFNGIVAAFYFLTNILFAFGYVLCGPGALQGSTAMTFGDRFLEAFFFSVQTLATIGYGTMSPHGLAANILVTLEALVGLMGFALATGLLFSRFSRPSAKIIFSKNAVIAPYKDITGFMFRIANERTNELIEVGATVVLSRNETIDSKPVRKFYPLTLERPSVMFMPLHWVIVHPINALSPLYGVTKESFDASDAEILILLVGTDETFSQAVHARSSYKNHEVVWDAKFSDMFLPSGNVEMSIDLKKIHDIEKM